MEQGFTEFLPSFSRVVVALRARPLPPFRAVPRTAAILAFQNRRGRAREFFIEFHFNPFFLPFKFLFTEFID